MPVQVNEAPVEQKTKQVLFLTSADSDAVKISLKGVPSASGAILNYITAPANQPKSFGNHLYVWQTTSNIVPWDKTPDGDTAIGTDSSTSTQLVPFKFENKGYIIGYAVAASPQAVCSTIYMPAGKQDDPSVWEYSNVSLQVVYVGTNLVQVKYGGLQSYLPATSKNWIGIWPGAVVPYSGSPLASVNIDVDAPSSGYQVIQGIQLLIGYSYVVGYFTADPKSGRTALAASGSFIVGA